jgi:hypothetical protein
VRVGGKLLEFSRKLPRKTLLLLKAIIALGGKEVPEQALCDALWRDEDGDAARNAFAITVLRLRKLLGVDRDGTAAGRRRIAQHGPVLGRCRGVRGAPRRQPIRGLERLEPLWRRIPRARPVRARQGEQSEAWQYATTAPNDSRPSTLTRPSASHRIDHPLIAPASSPETM